MWQHTVQDKKTIFGAARVAVGGRPGDQKDQDDPSSSVSAKKGKKDQSSLEPVFFHSHGETLWEELLHSVSGPKDKIKCIVDCTPGDGALAHVAIRTRPGSCKR